MRRVIIAAALLLCGAAISAQNLNPTVQVTNAFKGTDLAGEKLTVPMAVPDSLLKFDWDFNYSVFDNPYKGAYEFTPYLIEMRPDPVPYDGHKFYLRAGAGYSLHPELQAMFNPSVGKNFTLSIYDDLTGYWGNYWEIQPIRIKQPNIYRAHQIDTFGGDRFDNRFGAAARYDAAKAVVSFDGSLGYLHSSQSDLAAHSALRPSASLDIASRFSSPLSLGVRLSYSGTMDNVYGRCYVSGSPVKEIDSRMTEHDLGVQGAVSYGFASYHAFRLGASFGRIMSSWESKDGHTSHLTASPSYRFSNGRFSAALGVKMSLIRPDFGPGKRVEETETADTYKSRKLYPDASLRLELIPEALAVDAKVTGGSYFNTYSSYLESNNFLSASLSEQYMSQLGDVTVNTFDASLGFSGRVKSKVQFAARAGYGRYYNSPMEGIQRLYQGQPFFMEYDLSNYDLMYADAEGSWHSDALDASFHMRLQEAVFSAVTTAFTLPKFVGSAAVTYNWHKRIYAGVGAEWMTDRIYDGDGEFALVKGFTCEVPGWVDLSANLEYRFSRKMSFWAKGGNLLGQTIMRNYGVAEKGPYATLGICLIL